MTTHVIVKVGMRTRPHGLSRNGPSSSRILRTVFRPSSNTSGRNPSRVLASVSASAASAEMLSKSGPPRTSARERVSLPSSVPFVDSVTTRPRSVAIATISPMRGCSVGSPIVCKVIRGMPSTTISSSKRSYRPTSRNVFGRIMSLLPQYEQPRLQALVGSTTMRLGTGGTMP